MTTYHLTDYTNTYWPGALSYRDEHSRRGYLTREAAERRALQVAEHYAATRGEGGPDLRVVERDERVLFTCRGSVCGGCGITHLTLAAARACCGSHHASVRRAYPSEYPTRAYSDRVPVALNAAAEREMERDERAL